MREPSIVDAGQHERLQGLLFAILIQLDDRITPRDAGLIHEFIDVGELGLALEQIADLLAEAQAPITDSERADLETLAYAMDLDQRVPQALESCPPLE
jgi:hypothetical protein